jgi:hypothetical protein
MTGIKRRILLFSALSLLQFAMVYFVLIKQFPNSGDEASYLFQAPLFAAVTQVRFPLGSPHVYSLCIRCRILFKVRQ